MKPEPPLVFFPPACFAACSTIEAKVTGVIPAQVSVEGQTANRLILPVPEGGYLLHVGTILQQPHREAVAVADLLV
jgi:hypothetical protein